MQWFRRSVAWVVIGSLLFGSAAPARAAGAGDAEALAFREQLNKLSELDRAEAASAMRFLEERGERFRLATLQALVAKRSRQGPLQDYLSERLSVFPPLDLFALLATHVAGPLLVLSPLVPSLTAGTLGLGAWFPPLGVALTLFAIYQIVSYDRNRTANSRLFRMEVQELGRLPPAREDFPVRSRGSGRGTSDDGDPWAGLSRR